MAPKVLLVHPSPAESALDRRLQGEGYQVLRAENGLKLVSHLEVEQPDVIIMETRSAWSDSFQLCSALRHGRFARTPVFFLSSNPDEDECRHSYDCGCTQYFHMPRQMPALIRRIRECAGAP